MEQLLFQSVANTLAALAVLWFAALLAYAAAITLSADIGKK